MSEQATMAKAKKKRPSPGRHRNPVVLTVRGSDEWRAWIERAANHLGISTSALVDVALAEYVKTKGFGELPPKRS